MIGRYVLATAAVVLLVVGLLLGTVIYLGLHYGAATDSRVRIGTLAEALTPTADGLQLDPARTPADWLQGYAWAMALDDDGSVIWQHDLPQNLNKHYTASEIASFSRWYLDDWPVFCWTADYGLFVAAVPRGSVWKYNICNNEQLMNAMAAGMLPALGVAAACCLLFSWRGARRLQTIAAGLATVADGGTIRLPTDGFAGELADTVNRTSEQLRRRNEIIARRDDARTSWIAGVSHDVRTPLALILGWAEQLEQDTALPAAARQKACGIRTQSEKLRALIEDLNLTSKLQYGAQPLRCQPTQAGPLLRRLAAEFCDSPLAARCTVTLEIAPDADKAILDADAALLARAVENLLHNAACHNPSSVQVQLSAVRTGKTLRITIADDGAGYPPAVLHALQTGEAGENTPHILGLHVVEQIIRAHGDTAAFCPERTARGKGGAGAACDGRSCRTVGVGDVPPAAFPQKSRFPQGCGPGVPGPCGECDIFLILTKKVILILVDFLGITLYNVYYKIGKGGQCAHGTTESSRRDRHCGGGRGIPPVWALTN
mgnify:CR=1 FL=1